MLCEVFSVIYIVLDSTALQVWHFALLPAFNIHCSELTTQLFLHYAHYVFISSDLNMMLSALVQENGFLNQWKSSYWSPWQSVVGTFFYVIMKGKQECRYASNHQIYSTQQWMQAFFLSADMDWQCVKDQQGSSPYVLIGGHHNLEQHSCKTVKSSAILCIKQGKRPLLIWKVKLSLHNMWKHAEIRPVISTTCLSWQDKKQHCSLLIDWKQTAIFKHLRGSWRVAGAPQRSQAWEEEKTHPSFPERA